MYVSLQDLVIAIEMVNIIGRRQNLSKPRLPLSKGEDKRILRISRNKKNAA